MIDEKDRAKLREMHKRIGTWKGVAEELQASISTIYRYRKGKVRKPRGDLVGKLRSFRVGYSAPKGVEKQEVYKRIEPKGVVAYRYTEGSVSQNAQYGILMNLLTKPAFTTGLPKVNDPSFASDIANNIDKLSNIRGSLVTYAEMLNDKGQLAATLTMQGFLPKFASKIYDEFKGPVNFSQKADKFIISGVRQGIMIAGQKRQIIMESPLFIQKIRLSYDFA